jgi:hypothetical protein
MWLNVNGSNEIAGNTRGAHLFYLFFFLWGGFYQGTDSWPKVVDALRLSYRTVKHLNQIVDRELPGRPRFQCRVLIVGEERLEFYCRDVIECIRSLYGDPQLAQDLVFAPEQHYTSAERTCRLYNEMHTGDWWWAVQVNGLKLHKYLY